MPACLNPVGNSARSTPRASCVSCARNVPFGTILGRPSAPPRASSSAGLLLAILLLSALAAHADEEQDLIAVLQSSASVPEKSAACQKLRVLGTSKSVPALASLLADEPTAHAARHALEGLPCPQAGKALRAALATTTGPVQIGIVDSLGWRGEPESVAALNPFLASTNLDLALSVVSALGRIDSDQALPPLVLLNGLAESAPGIHGSIAFRSALQLSLLRWAERLRDRNDIETARLTYETLFGKPASDSLRVAAWRGLVLTDTPRRQALIRQALAGPDRSLRLAAQRLVREMRDVSLIAECLADWSSLPAQAQLALLDAHVQSGAPALPTLQQALTSPHIDVRVAALEALADAGDPSLIPALAKAAASAQPAECAAARQSLARVRGPGIRDALLECLDSAAPAEQAELLRALGARADRESGKVLLRYAAAESGPVRLAALESLQRLALPETLSPLLESAIQPKSEDQLDPIFRALSAVCQASPDRSQTEGRVIEAIRSSAPAERRRLLPLLAELGTPEALAAALAAMRDPDLDLSRQAVRILTQWPNAAPAADLLERARTNADPALQTLALRGGIEVSGLEPDGARRLDLLQRALSLARRADEKRLVLAQVASLPSPAALDLALRQLADPDLVNEAGLAAIAVAEKLAPTAAGLADEAAVKVLEACAGSDTVRRAWALRRTPAAAGGFIHDWLVCGPFRQAGVEGATAVFDLVLGPEKPDAKPDWKRVSAGDHVDLAALFPGEVNCVGYLQTQIVAPGAIDALLLMGSDDGLKAWLNGVLVHSHNVDRGMVVDQDRAPIKLKPGRNQLLLKVTQGGGGWAACARVLTLTGQPIDGLHVAPLDRAP